MESKTKKYLLWGLGAVAVATGGFFLFKHLQEKKDEKAMDDLKDQVSEETTSSTSSGSAASSSPTKKPIVYNQFPLKYGSKGTLVRDIQTVLNKRYKAGVDVDGDWQGQTETALKKFNLPTSFDSQAYAKFVAGTSAKSESKKPSKHKSATFVSSKTIAKKLHDSIEKDDIFQAVSALKLIKSKTRYNDVNDEFKKEKNWSFSDGYVSRTVVNALLDQFGSSEYKKRLNDEFYRIGLKYDGSKWSLSGLLAGTEQLMTIQPTQVWDAKGNRMSVPRSTILGTFVQAKNGITEFETLDGRILYTNTIQIKYAG
nr:hypothetical protein [uncultured Fluviicola sp.]